LNDSRTLKIELKPGNSYFKYVFQPQKVILFFSSE
jgi:hypothetical protein